MTPDVMFAPAPGAAPLRRMIAAQAVLETRTLLRNGEQLLLTLVIPLLLLAAFGLEPLVNLGAGMSRIDFLTPGIIAPIGAAPGAGVKSAGENGSGARAPTTAGPFRSAQGTRPRACGTQSSASSAGRLARRTRR